MREYRTAVSLRPNSAEIHNNLATTLRDLGQHEEAVAHYRQATEHAPDIAEIWYNLANALGEHGAPEEVEKCFRRALALKPDFANAHANFGRWLMTQARWADAETPLAEAAAPGSDAGADLEQSRHCAAGARPGRGGGGVLPLRPGAGAGVMPWRIATWAACCWSKAGPMRRRHARRRRSRPIRSAARRGWRCAWRSFPSSTGTEAEIAVRRQRYAAALDSLAGALQAPAAARSLAAAIGTAQPFFLPYQGRDDRSLQATYGQLACRVLAATEPSAKLAPRPKPGERIRLGIVSGFFCRHTIFKLFLEGWLTQLDRSRFEVIGFHTGRTSDTDEAAAGWCDRFVHTLPSSTAWREAVTDAAPHVLLYPEVGMDPIAGRLAAQRLAPVQCVAWGQPETTGMPTLDHFLSSDLMEPLDSAAHYTESLVRLPNLGLCFLPDALPACPAGPRRVGVAAGPAGVLVRPGAVQIPAAYDAIFPRIAKAVGACRFVFIGFAKSKAVTAAFRERLGRAFAAAGLDAEAYCVVLPPMSPEHFVAAVGVADVVLDTPGWSGGKSTLDCLAQDPAIVTLPGPFMRGRHTAAILQRIGCPATIAASLDDYVAIAARLGRDAAWRSQVRQAVAHGKARAFRDFEYMRALEAFLADAVARA